MARLLEVLFLPPLAIARVGGSDTPLDSFTWETDVNPYGTHQTVIRPAVSLEVLPDGSLLPYLPHVIRFLDGELLRPAAPFFELWARVQRPDPRNSEEPRETAEPLTLQLLHELGASLDSIHYTITVANRKAARRTQQDSCAFMAREEVPGYVHARIPLLAWSPHFPNQEPLVFKERPIPLGVFQVIKPIPWRSMGVDLSVLRVRFTPARGEVYGPPSAIEAMASVVPPGFPTTRLIGRMHAIVKPENRILNEKTPWTTYYWDAPGQIDPQPSDSYDGAHEGQRVSWGVVDDTCDGVIQAQVLVDGQRFIASTRVLSGCPDYAPDRRHFAALADDLADRDLPDREVRAETIAEVEAEVADLFQRVFEVLSQINVDAIRDFSILDNSSAPSEPNFEGLPQVDQRTMTIDDKPYVDLIPATLDSWRVSQQSVGAAHDEVPYTLAARAAHAPNTDIDTLIDLLKSKSAHIRLLLRPPFGRFWQLETEPGPRPAGAFRDPRVPRDLLQDMRMPPYMRDSDENPLSLSWRQYREVMDFLDYLETIADGAEAASPSRRRREVQRLVQRIRQGQPAR